MTSRPVLGLLLALAAQGATAQEAAIPPAPAVIPSGAVVEIEITQAVSSYSGKLDDTFTIRLADPIMIDGKVAAPAGLKGVGQITTVSPAGLAGKPGRLLLTARYLEFDGRRMPLRAFTMGRDGAGANNTAGSVAASLVVGLPALFITGGNVHVPVGARATAKLAAPFELPSPGTSTAPPSVEAPQAASVSEPNFTPERTVQ